MGGENELSYLAGIVAAIQKQLGTQIKVTQVSSAVLISAVVTGADQNAVVSIANDAKAWLLQTRGDTSDAFIIRESGVADRFCILVGGNVGIGTTAPTSKLQVVGLPEHADNAAALLAGLTVGAFYRTGDALKVVH